MEQLFRSNDTPAEIRNSVRPDFKTNGLTLMSHSAGGHVVCLYLEKNCGNVRSLIMLDPVDGYDPFGIINDYVTNPPNKLSFQIPTLIVSSELSAIAPSFLIPPCAPANISNMRFFNALSGPTWYLNFTAYGHADLLDDYVNKNFYFFFFI